MIYSRICFKNNDFLQKNLITYIGNKRNLLPFIYETIIEIMDDEGKEKLSFFDGFSGSGSVARLFKYYANELYVNDLEGYSETINKCFLSNKSELDIPLIKSKIDYLNKMKLLFCNDIGFIETHYAPKNDTLIQEHERVFYTNTNAKIIDNIRKMIFTFDTKLQTYLLAPLLIKASIHTNTSGVFKGFHKKNGIGHFGGKDENSLRRIKEEEITLDYPKFSVDECPTHVMRGNTNEIVKEIPQVNVAYYDPPYNQHPYGSNYFMLNIINDYNNPEIQNGVSGIIKDWNRSEYNKKQQAEIALERLIIDTKANYIIFSYNNEGIISIVRFKEILEKYGQVTMKTKSYITYRGSKNTGNNKKLLNGDVRSIEVDELLWILKKK